MGLGWLMWVKRRRKPQASTWMDRSQFRSHLGPTGFRPGLSPNSILCSLARTTFATWAFKRQPLYFQNFDYATATVYILHSQITFCSVAARSTPMLAARFLNMLLDPHSYLSGAGLNFCLWLERLQGPESGLCHAGYAHLFERKPFAHCFPTKLICTFIAHRVAVIT